MIKIKEHLLKIEEIKKQINNSKGNQKRQYIKHLHRLQKEFDICNNYLNEIK